MHGIHNEAFQQFVTSVDFKIKIKKKVKEQGGVKYIR